MELDYLKGEWKGFKETIQWGAVWFFIIVGGISVILFGWWGILVYIIIQDAFTDGGVGGGWVDSNDYSQKFPPNTCSAGKEDCTICNNEYSHEFNENYKEENYWKQLWKF